MIHLHNMSDSVLIQRVRDGAIGSSRRVQRSIDAAKSILVLGMFRSGGGFPMVVIRLRCPPPWKPNVYIGVMPGADRKSVLADEIKRVSWRTWDEASGWTTPTVRLRPASLRRLMKKIRAREQREREARCRLQQ